MNGQMTAKKLRVALFAAVFLVIIAIAGGFLFVQRNLAGYAAQISLLQADSNSGDQTIATLRNLEARLDEEKDTTLAARSIVAENESFAEQVVNDVTRIASQSGVAITGLEYVDSAAGTPTTATPTAPATPTATAPGATAPGAGAPPSGVTKKSISVTIESPVDYNKLLNFIQKIESNNLRLQIATVTLSKETGNLVGTPAFSIGAYVR